MCRKAGNHGTRRWSRTHGRPVRRRAEWELCLPQVWTHGSSHGRTAVYAEELPQMRHADDPTIMLDEQGDWSCRVVMAQV